MKMKRLVLCVMLLFFGGTTVAMAATQYDYAMQSLLAVDTGTTGITLPTWDFLGRWIAYVKSPGASSELWVVDVTNLTTIRCVLNGSAGAGIDPLSSLAWTPDGNSVLYTTTNYVGNGYRRVINKVHVADGVVTAHAFDAATISAGFNNANISIRDPFIVHHPTAGYFLVVAAVDEVNNVSSGIWAAPINVDGTTSGPWVKVLDVATTLLTHPVYSTAQDYLVVEETVSSTCHRLWMVRQIVSVYEGLQSPLTDLSTARCLTPVSNTVAYNQYCTQAHLSNDGIAIFFSWDVSGTYDDSNAAATYATANFEITIVTFVNADSLQWDPRILALPGNQTAFTPAPNKTCLAYVDGSSLQQGSATLDTCSLQVSSTILLRLDNSTTSSIWVPDLVGGAIFVPPNTVVNSPTMVKTAKNAKASPTITVSVACPLSVPQEVSNSAAAVRQWEPSGTTFTPPVGGSPVTMVTASTPAELISMGVDTNGLTVVTGTLTTNNVGGAHSHATGMTTVTNVTKDAAHNTVSYPISHFSFFAATNPKTIDWSGDGTATWQEIYGPTPTRPANIDSNGDGWSDGLEVTLGYNPFDTSPTATHPDPAVNPPDMPPATPAPAASVGGLVLTGLLLAGITVHRLRRRKAK